MLNYAVIIQYLTQQLNIPNVRIAEWLNLDPSIISNIKNNKRKMQKDISYDVFYRDVFCQAEIGTDFQSVHSLYTYLQDKDCSNEVIDMAYSHYKEHRSVENAETFLLTLLKEVKYEKDAVSSKSASKSTHRSPSDAIAFEPFHNPIQNNTFFGRQDMFEKIRSVLCSLGTCIIYGIGGLGKSYCSLKYAAEYEDSYTQIQQIIFTGDIKNTILKIKFTGLDESHFSEDEKFEKRLSILASYGEDTLLIIDNMDTHPADRENYVRLKELPIHILFTSRETDLDSEKFLLPIHPLSKQEQLQLFMHYGRFTIPEDEYGDYFKIFNMVEGHTLLLELIAKTMTAETLTPEEMTDILYSPEYDDISKVVIEKDNTYQQEKMNNFISKLFDTSNLTDVQKEILMNLSLTSISGIRQRLFKQFLDYNNSDINALIRQSWIIQNRPNGPASSQIHLHPVIKAAVINNTEPSLEKCSVFINKIIEFLKAASADVIEDSMSNDLCDVLANAGLMLKYTSEHLGLMYDIALILWRSLMYHESYSYLTKGLELLNKESSDDIELQLSYYETAGKVAVRLADYEKAITHYQSAITTIENSGQDFSERLATIYDNLGVVMRKASKYEQALDYFTKAQNIIDINHIKNPELTSDIYNDMGVIYINLDIFDKALANYQKAREIRESVENPDLEQIAYSYHNIGTVYQRQKKYADAITWHKKALEIRQEIYPDNEPIIAASLTMIGNDYTQAAKNDSSYHFNDAFEYFAKGLEIRKLTLGETHPDTAWSYQSIGLWHFYQGEYEEAIENYLKCLSIRKTILQPSHAYTAEISYLLGEAYLKINQIHSAKEHLLLAEKIQASLHKVKALEKTQHLLKECSLS